MKCFVTVVLLASFAFVSAFLSSSVLPRRTALRMKGPEKRMEELGIKLPPPPKAAASYVPSNACGNMLYLSGHLPIKNDGTLITGRIGEGGRDVKCGQEAARQVGLNLIATLKNDLGDLNRVKSIVKLFGIVQSTDEFKEHHLVMNGVSDLLREVFGEIGVHSRSAIGTNSLPLDISVEVEAIVEVTPLV